jgi:hypothetical protein
MHALKGVCQIKLYGVFECIFFRLCPVIQILLKSEDKVGIDIALFFAWENGVSVTANGNVSLGNGKNLTGKFSFAHFVFELFQFY